MREVPYGLKFGLETFDSFYNSLNAVNGRLMQPPGMFEVMGLRGIERDINIPSQ